MQSHLTIFPLSLVPIHLWILRRIPRRSILHSHLQIPRRSLVLIHLHIFEQEQYFGNDKNPERNNIMIPLYSIKKGATISISWYVFLIENVDWKSISPMNEECSSHWFTFSSRNIVMVMTVTIAIAVYFENMWSSGNQYFPNIHGMSINKPTIPSKLLYYCLLGAWQTCWFWFHATAMKSWYLVHLVPSWSGCRWHLFWSDAND